MESTQSDASPGGTALRDALERCLESKAAPNYKQNFERVVSSWIDWCDSRGVHTLEDVSKRTMGNYASRLTQRVDAKKADAQSGLTASSAWTYYDMVSAFLSWAVAWDYLVENPAEKAVARDQMPARPSSGDYDRQFWSDDQRHAVIEYTRCRADSACRGPPAPTPLTHKRLRDHALVGTIAYTGVRGGEVLKDHSDDRRTGLRWSNVDLEEGTLRILGKNQQYEDAQLPQQSVQPLRRWHRALEPPTSEWPVFPSMHVPTLSRLVATHLGGDERDRRLAETHVWNVILESGIQPPSITTEGGRSVLKGLSRDGAVPGLNHDEDEYLTLHGARRGVGEKLYRERGPAAAQRTLRHADPATTSKMYSHIEASELADDVTEVFDE